MENGMRWLACWLLVAGCASRPGTAPATPDDDLRAENERLREQSRELAIEVREADRERARQGSSDSDEFAAARQLLQRESSRLGDVYQRSSVEVARVYTELRRAYGELLNQHEADQEAEVNRARVRRLATELVAEERRDDADVSGAVWFALLEADREQVFETRTAVRAALSSARQSAVSEVKERRARFDAFLRKLNESLDDPPPWDIVTRPLR